MMLLVGDPDDGVIETVRRRMAAARADVRVVPEDRLFTDVRFGLELRGGATSGFVRLDGHDVALTDLAAVVLRPPRRWWPSDDFGLKDQLFVYHETVAAWLTLCTGLACPVVNRFELGWWLQDPNYPARLRADLVRRLGCHEATGGPAPSVAGRLVPLPPDHDPRAVSVYLAGSRVVPGTPAANRCTAWLASQAAAVAGWRHAHGLGLCRLDFDPVDPPALAHVEVFPPLHEEQQEVVGAVAEGVVEMVA